MPTTIIIIKIIQACTKDELVRTGQDYILLLPLIIQTRHHRQ